MLATTCRAYEWSDEVHRGGVLAAARAGYAQGQAEFDVPADRTALLVIDMQDEFVRPEWSPYWVPGATRLAPRLARFIAACRSLRIPVILSTACTGSRYSCHPITSTRCWIWCRARGAVDVRSIRPLRVVVRGRRRAVPTPCPARRRRSASRARWSASQRSGSSSRSPANRPCSKASSVGVSSRTIPGRSPRSSSTIP
jgi:Isochorismatase family